MPAAIQEVRLLQTARAARRCLLIEKFVKLILYYYDSEIAVSVCDIFIQPCTCIFNTTFAVIGQQ